MAYNTNYTLLVLTDPRYLRYLAPQVPKVPSGPTCRQKWEMGTTTAPPNVLLH